MKLSGLLNAFSAVPRVQFLIRHQFFGRILPLMSFQKKNFLSPRRSTLCNLAHSRFFRREAYWNVIRKSFPPFREPLVFSCRSRAPYFQLRSVFELLDIWDSWLVTVWLSDLRSNSLAPLLVWGRVPSCCGSRFRDRGSLPLRPSLSEMFRLGSLLVLGFSMAHSPNLQGILTSVGNFVDLVGHFTYASWGVPCVRDLFLPKYRTRITSSRGSQVYESFPSISCDRLLVFRRFYSVRRLFLIYDNRPSCSGFVLCPSLPLWIAHAVFPPLPGTLVLLG